MSSIFDDVKRELNIKQVVEFYGYKVNRAGKFICPFHNDTHPSASIKNDYFNCFVCGAGGDVITFTAKLFGLKNIDACKKLIEDFGLNIQTGQQSNISRLRADRIRQKRLQEQKEREKLDALIRYTGDVLSSYHCYLWQGIHLYPPDNERHIRGLQELTQAEYYIECYDSDPAKYSINQQRQVRRIEERLRRWNNER